MSQTYREFADLRVQKTTYVIGRNAKRKTTLLNSTWSAVKEACVWRAQIVPITDVGDRKARTTRRRSGQVASRNYFSPNDLTGLLVAAVRGSLLRDRNGAEVGRHTVAFNYPRAVLLPLTYRPRHS